MKKVAKNIIFLFNIFGFDIIKFIYSLKGLWSYLKDYFTLKKQMKDSNEFYFGKFFPILNEKFTDSGVMKGHYFHQDLLIARGIYENKPHRHIDIGSRIDGFVAHVAT
jgi:hypothetical protein